MKHAIFTMDVEDFSDIPFVKEHPGNYPSMMDGFDIFLDFLDQKGIKGTFFVLANRIERDKPFLEKALDRGHFIGMHGYDHSIPSSLDPKEFAEKLTEGKKIIEEAIGLEIRGYRGAGFGVSNDNLESIRAAGFAYDSSVLPVSKNFPSYGHSLLLDDYSPIANGVRLKDGFYEFLMPVYHGRVIGDFPVGGGIYSRLLPFNLFMSSLRSYLKKADTYIFYVHPFELSEAEAPSIKGLMPHQSLYVTQCRGQKYLKRIETIMETVIKAGFSFSDFEETIKQLETKKD